MQHHVIADHLLDGLLALLITTAAKLCKEMDHVAIEVHNVLEMTRGREGEEVSKAPVRFQCRIALEAHKRGNKPVPDCPDSRFE